MDHGHQGETISNAAESCDRMQCPRTFYTDVDNLICKRRSLNLSLFSLPGTGSV
jgi:hypothetical protein